MEVKENAGIYARLAAAQAEYPPVPAGRTATVKSRRTGQTFTYNYATLADIVELVKPKLAAKGICWTQTPVESPRGSIIIQTTLYAPDGSNVEGFAEVPSPVDGGPQDYGSAISYARRYSFCMTVGVAVGEEDDDGQKAQGGQNDVGGGGSWQAPAPAPEPETPAFNPSQAALELARRAEKLGLIEKDGKKVDSSRYLALVQKATPGLMLPPERQVKGRMIDWANLAPESLAEIVKALDAYERAMPAPEPPAPADALFDDDHPLV